MSTEPSAAPDTKPPAESAEFEDFFERGARDSSKDAPVRAEPQQQAEDFDVPRLTLQQLARRTRLRRAVGLLVSGLGVAFLVLFANRGLRGSEPVLRDSALRKDQPAPVPVNAVATSLGAARPHPTTAPLSTPTSAAEPALREALASTATPPLAPPAVGVAIPVAHRTAGAHALAPVPPAESPRRPAALSGAPFRAASAPVRATLPSRPSRAAEPPATASFPVDPQ